MLNITMIKKHLFAMFIYYPLVTCQTIFIQRKSTLSEYMNV